MAPIPLLYCHHQTKISNVIFQQLLGSLQWNLENTGQSQWRETGKTCSKGPGLDSNRGHCSLALVTVQKLVVVLSKIWKAHSYFWEDEPCQLWWPFTLVSSSGQKCTSSCWLHFPNMHKYSQITDKLVINNICGHHNKPLTTHCTCVWSKVQGATARFNKLFCF